MTTRPIPREAILLAVEVVSKGSRSQDRGSKPLEYAEAGIPETRQTGALSTTVYAYVLEAGRYELAGEYADRLRVANPFAVDIELGGLTG